MSDNETSQQDELKSLKKRADLLGIKYHPSISLEKLRDKVNGAMEDKDIEDETPSEDAPKKESPLELRKRLKKEALKLVRIRLTCMNPAKKDWDGEIIATGNTYIGTVKKYIPFNAPEGWYVPHILYEVLRDRMFQNFVTVKLPGGLSHRQGRLEKEFAIEVLPDLEEEELKELARRQAMSKAID